jgi:hypothetical protein
VNRTATTHETTSETAMTTKRHRGGGDDAVELGFQTRIAELFARLVEAGLSLGNAGLRRFQLLLGEIQIRDGSCAR